LYICTNIIYIFAASNSLLSTFQTFRVFKEISLWWGLWSGRVVQIRWYIRIFLNPNKHEIILCTRKQIPHRIITNICALFPLLFVFLIMVDIYCYFQLHRNYQNQWRRKVCTAITVRLKAMEMSVNIYTWEGYQDRSGVRKLGQVNNL
jgi:hypothetical protein